MKIAICGIRGVPACYGGFETFAEELGQRLVSNGHQVRVYGRSHIIDYDQPSYLGMEIVRLPAPRHKYLETPVHTFRSFRHLLRHPVDIVLLCNAANSPFAWMPRVKRIPVVINLDGIERKRAKWNAIGRAWYRLGEITSVLFGSRLVADADIISDYYRETYRKETEIIRYGCIGVPADSIAQKLRLPGSFQFAFGALNEQLLRERFQLESGRYLLYVSRLEPENNAHRVVAAYSALNEELRRQMPLVVVGDAPYADDYKAEVRRLAAPEVRFLGFQFGEPYRLLGLGAYTYIQATEVGGTHPALVESMGFANAIIANDVPEHREVLKDAGVYYPKNNEGVLSSLMRDLINDPPQVVRLRQSAYARAQAEFSWGKITNDYEQLFARVLTGQG